MKLTFIISLLISLSVLAQSEKRTVTFDKNTQGGYNIYSNSGELLYVYTKKNCDSTTLETLNDIYFDATVSNSENKTSSKSLSVKIENLPQNDSIIWQMLKVFIPTLVGIIFGWLLSYIPQRNQSIQTVFFNLLENQNKILDNCTIKYVLYGNEVEANGTKYFAYLRKRMVDLYQFLKRDYNIEYTSTEALMIDSDAVGLIDNYTNHDKLINFYKNKPKLSKEDDNNERKLALYVFSFVFYTYQESISNYFRHLYNLISYIDNSYFLFGKKKLINFVKAKMSDSEIFILFYDGLKYPNMKNMIEKYTLIRNLYKQDLLNEDHEKFYKVELLHGKSKV